MRETIHPVNLLRVRSLSPNLLAFLCLYICDCDGSVPITREQILDLFLFAFFFVRFTLEFERIIWEPASSLKSNFWFLIGTLLTRYSHRFANVNIQLSNHKIMDWKDRRDTLIPLVIFVHVEVCAEFLCESDVLSVETNIALHIRKHRVVLSFYVHCSHWWVMRHLLCKELKSVCLHFVGFKEQWVKRLADRLFTYSLWRNHVGGDQGKTHEWVIFFRCLIQQVGILIRLSYFL